MKLRIYLGQAMSGHACKDIRRKAIAAKTTLELYGFDVWSPVLEENVPDTDETLTVLSKEDLLAKWLMDKHVGLRRCHIFLDLDGDMHSEGMNVERGIMRWYQWKPTIRIKKPGHVYSISDIEDDCIAHSLAQAALLIEHRWGTRRKWVMWKLKHILFGIPKHVWVQINTLWL